MERGRRTGALAYVDAVERERVKVYVEPQGRIEALHDGDRPRERVIDAREPELALGAPAERAAQLRDEGSEDVRAELAIVAEQVAEPPRQRADPLADGGLGQHRLHEVRREIIHPPAEARRAEASSLTAEGQLAAAGLPPTRALLARFVPSPGEGPSAEARARGSFVFAIRAASAAGTKVTGIVEGNQDPGYGATAVMLGEAALCLAQDALTTSGGVTTPAAAMGMALVERLRAQGIGMSVI